MAATAVMEATEDTAEVTADMDPICTAEVMEVMDTVDMDKITH